MIMRLEAIQRETDLIPSTVDVAVEFGVRRSIRRGSNTHAKNMGVLEEFRNLIARWRKVERARGANPSLNSMSDLYTEVRQALPSYLRYSQPL